MLRNTNTSTELYSNTALFKALFQSSSIIYMVLSTNGTILLFNPAAEVTTGYSASDAEGTTPWALFFNTKNAKKAHRLFQSISQIDSSISVEMELRARGGESHLIQWSVQGVNIKDDVAEFIIISGIDISNERFYKEKAISYAKESKNFHINNIVHLKQTNQRLNQLSITDHLTNLYNRRHFDNELEKFLRQSKRGERVISLLFCDIDYFKLYNDTYGHVSGDLALQETAKLLSSCSQRAEDIVARYGGEEFALILPGTDSSGALNVATRIMNKLAHKKIPHETSPVKPYLTISIGVVTTDVSHIDDINELIKLADQQLYEAKGHGRNNIMSQCHILDQNELKRQIEPSEQIKNYE